jgi:hypothetical protein
LTANLVCRDNVQNVHTSTLVLPAAPDIGAVE